MNCKRNVRIDGMVIDKIMLTYGGICYPNYHHLPLRVKSKKGFQIGIGAHSELRVCPPEYGSDRAGLELSSESGFRPSKQAHG